MNRFWICSECGTLNYDWGISACLGCNCDIEECDKIYQDDEGFDNCPEDTGGDI
jgi:hypothetical protein